MAGALPSLVAALSPLGVCGVSQRAQRLQLWSRRSRSEANEGTLSGCHPLLPPTRSRCCDWRCGGGSSWQSQV